MATDSKLHSIYIICLVTAAGFFCYANSLGGDFVWDDTSFVVNNPSIRTLKNAGSFFTDPLTLAAKPSLSLDNYRPLVTFSFAGNYLFCNLNPFGYHLTNLFFHILNGILVYFLIRVLTKDNLIAAMSGIIFVIHPVHTEAVSWISSRGNVLFLFFYLAALFSFIKFRQIKGKNRILYCSSLLLFTASLFSKEMAASLPLMVIMYDICFNVKGNFRLRTKILEWLPFFVVLLLYIGIRRHLIGHIAQCSYLGGRFYYTFLSTLRTVVYYFKLLLWPQYLCVSYALDISRSFFEPKVILSAVILTAIIILTVTLYKKHRKEAFFVLWFFIAILPTANLIPMRILIAERFLYLPAIGIFALFAVTVNRLIKNKKILLLVSLFLFVLLSNRTIIRNYDWENEITLFKSAVGFCPENPRLYLNLGNALSEAKLFNEAEKEFKKALRLDPHFSKVYTGLAKLYMETKRENKAKDILEEGLKKIDNNKELLNSFGVFYARRKDYSMALSCFEKVLELEPANIKAYLNKARVLEKEHNYEEAVNTYRKLLKTNPNRYYQALALLRNGDIYLRNGEINQAGIIWQRILKDYAEQKAICEIIRNEKILLLRK